MATNPHCNLPLLSQTLQQRQELFMDEIELHHAEIKTFFVDGWPDY